MDRGTNCRRRQRKYRYVEEICTELQSQFDAYTKHVLKLLDEHITMTCRSLRGLTISQQKLTNELLRFATAPVDALRQDFLGKCLRAMRQCQEGFEDVLRDTSRMSVAVRIRAAALQADPPELLVTCQWHLYKTGVSVWERSHCRLMQVLLLRQDWLLHLRLEQALPSVEEAETLLPTHVPSSELLQRLGNANALQWSALKDVIAMDFDEHRNLISDMWRP